MASELAKRSCIPWQGGTPPLTMDAAGRLMDQLDGWEFEQGHITKVYTFPDFARALAFVNAVGAVAEQEGHHPDVYLSWGRVAIELWTHAADGLTDSDFILAAKCDEALEALPAGSGPSD